MTRPPQPTALATPASPTTTPAASPGAGVAGQPWPRFVPRPPVVTEGSCDPIAQCPACRTPDFLDEMFAACASMLVLDHHKTAESALAGAEYATFDMNRSGAGLAWDYFRGGKRPKLVDYVEDRDLWRHALPYSKEVNAWISTLEFEFTAWDDARLVDLEWMVRSGRVTLAKTDRYVREVRKNARRITFEGHDVPIVNAPQVDVSELGHALAQGELFAMAWWQRADGVFQYSLRSIGDFDVSDLAKRYGGGGHKNAAGFQSATLIG